MSLKEFLLSKVFFKNLGFAIASVTALIIVTLIWLNIYTRHGQSMPVPDFYGLSLQEASQLAKEHKLRLQVTDSIYTNVVPKGCIAEQNPKPGYKVKKWRRIILTINAFHPEMAEVPDLIGIPKRQALTLLQTAGFEPGQLLYVPDISVDFVLKQLHNGIELTPGDSLEKGSIIDLVLGKGLSNERTPVPDLTGLTYEQAKKTILSASLNLGAYIYDDTVITDDDSLKAFVYKQNPVTGEDSYLQLGSPIYIWLTTDSAKLPSDSTFVNIYDSLSVNGINNFPDL